MIFKKPKDVRYVDMAKYIDENAYRDDVDESLMYEYIFHLCWMISHKRNLFRKTAEYDDFSLYMSSYVMRRYGNKKQFTVCDGTPKMKRIKSVLNYIKKTVYHVSLMFKSETYSTKKAKLEDIDTSNIHNFRDCITSMSSEIVLCDFKEYLHNIPKTVMSVVEKTPYTGLDRKNLYISCMLTMMSWLTLPSKEEYRIDRLIKNRRCVDELIPYLYANERKNSVVVYGFDGKITDLVKVLCNKIRNLIIDDLNDILLSGNSEADVRDLLMDCLENV